MPNKTHGQHELFVHIGIWRRVFMREKYLIEHFGCLSKDIRFSIFWNDGRFPVWDKLHAWGVARNDALNSSRVPSDAPLYDSRGWNRRPLLPSPLLTPIPQVLAVVTAAAKATSAAAHVESRFLAAAQDELGFLPAPQFHRADLMASPLSPEEAAAAPDVTWVFSIGVGTCP